MSKRGSGSSARAGNGGMAAFNAASLPIKGSEKQVAWARDIIQSAFDTIDANIKRTEEQNKKEMAEFKQRHPSSKMTA